MQRKPVRIRGGVIVQGGIGLHDRNAPDTVQTPRHAVYRALVINTRVVGDANARSEYAVECDVVLLRNQARYLNVPVVQQQHGVNNVHDLWVPRPSTRVISDASEPLNLHRAISRRGLELPRVTRFDDTDGDIVLISFMDGLLDMPVIVGALTHPQTKRIVSTGSGWVEGNGGSERGTPQKDELYTRHAGSEFRVNAAGDVLFDTVGATADNVNETPAANGGQFRIRVKSAERFTVEMNGTDVLEVWKNGGQVRVDLGAGAAERLILGDSFMTFLNNFLTTVFNSHVHPTGVGPSGVPSVLATSMTDALLSDVAKTKKT